MLLGELSAVCVLEENVGFHQRLELARVADTKTSKLVFFFLLPFSVVLARFVLYLYVNIKTVLTSILIYKRSLYLRTDRYFGEKK